MSANAFAAWLAWQTFLKEDVQESNDMEQNAPIIANVPDLKIFETSNQTTLLKKTENGIECHLNDRRSGKRQGHRWTLSPAIINQIIESGDIYINPTSKIRTGLVSIGAHTNWLYSKSLFPDTASLHHEIVKLLRSVNA